MSIRVTDIPLAASGYDLTNKKIMVHDLTASNTSSTVLVDTSSIITTSVADGTYGDIVVLGSNWTVVNNAITFTKFQTLSAQTLIGNPTNSSSNASEITLSSQLFFSGNTLSIVDDSSIQQVNVLNNGVFEGSRHALNFVPGQNVTVSIVDDSINNQINITIDATPSTSLATGNYGDLTVSNSGDLWTINAGVVTGSKIAINTITYSNIQQAGALTLLGNPSFPAANITEITLHPTLQFSGTTLKVADSSSIQKVKLYYNGSLFDSSSALNFVFSNLITSVNHNSSDSSMIDINIAGKTSNTVSIKKDNVLVGTQPILNFLTDPSINLTLTNDTTNNKVDILIATNQSLSTTLQNVTDVGNVTTDDIKIVSDGKKIYVSNTADNNSISLISAATSGAYLSIISNVTGANIQLKADNVTSAYVYQLPNASGTIPISVNGVVADTTGNIVLTNTSVVEVVIGQQAATDLGLTAGAITYTDTAYIGKVIQIFRGNVNVPLIDPLDGTDYATFNSSTGTITFTASLKTNEIIKIIKTI